MVFEKIVFNDFNDEAKQLFPLISTDNQRKSTGNMLRVAGVTSVAMFGTMGQSYSQWNSDTDIVLLVSPVAEILLPSGSNTKTALRNAGLTAKEIYLSRDINFPSTNSDRLVSGWVHYIPSKNLLVSTANPFADEEILKKTIEHIKNLKPKFLTSDQRFRKEVLKRLQQAQQNRLRTRKQDLENLRNDEQSYMQSYRDVLSGIKSAEIDVEAIGRFLGNMDEKLDKDLEAIKKLPVVKKVAMTEQGIDVSFGHIFISGKVETGRKTEKGIVIPIIEERKVNIGNLTFHIGAEIKVSNTTPVQGHEHPHCRDGRACFGEARPKVEKMLAGMELVEIVKFLYAWAYSYSPENGPFTQLQTFFLANGVQK